MDALINLDSHVLCILLRGKLEDCVTYQLTMPYMLIKTKPLANPIRKFITYERAQKNPQVLLDKFHRRLYSTKHKVGENNVNILGLELHNPVFFVTALAVIAFVLFTLLLPDVANLWLNGTKNWVVNSFDWLFISVANIMVVFCLLLIVSPYGNIRIGGINAKPDFKRGSWLAMLFAAGMGIGLMFWSVAEPLAYASGWAELCYSLIQSGRP